MKLRLTSPFVAIPRTTAKLLLALMIGPVFLLLPFGNIQTKNRMAS